MHCCLHILPLLLAQTDWSWGMEIAKSLSLLVGGGTVGALGQAAFGYLTSRGTQEVDQSRQLDAQALSLIDKYSGRIAVLEAQHAECLKHNDAYVQQRVDDAGKMGAMQTELTFLRQHVIACDAKIVRLEAVAGAPASQTDGA